MGGEVDGEVSRGRVTLQISPVKPELKVAGGKREKKGGEGRDLHTNKI